MLLNGNDEGPDVPMELLNLVPLEEQPEEENKNDPDQVPIEELLPGLEEFLAQVAAPPPEPVLPAPLPVPAPDGDEARRRSVRLKNKTTSKLTPVERAQEVLMKKLNILGNNEKPREEHKQHFLNMFKEPLPPNALAAVEDLFGGGSAPGM